MYSLDPYSRLGLRSGFGVVGLRVSRLRVLLYRLAVEFGCMVLPV